MISRDCPPAYVHELIRGMAIHRPDAIAVAHAGGTLDFARLDELANRLGHHLRGAGVTPGSRVAVSLRPGPESIVAQVAIVKLGAAAVVLDPDCPENWLAFLLDSVEARMLVTVTDTLGRLALDRGFPVLLLDDTEWHTGSSAAPDAPVTDDMVCHIAYPGRPGGVPKAVVRTHGQLRTIAVPDAGPARCLVVLARGGAVQIGTETAA